MTDILAGRKATQSIGWILPAAAETKKGRRFPAGPGLSAWLQNRRAVGQRIVLSVFRLPPSGFWLLASAFYW